MRAVHQLHDNVPRQFRLREQLHRLLEQQHRYGRAQYRRHPGPARRVRSIMRKGYTDAIGVPHAAATRLGRLARALRRLGIARSGAAAPEFALLAPFLLGLMVPLADLGAYIYDYMEIQLAAQAGGEYAARHGWDPTGIQNAILAAAPNLHLHPFDNSSRAPTKSDVLPAPLT